MAGRGHTGALSTYSGEKFGDNHRFIPPPAKGGGKDSEVGSWARGSSSTHDDECGPDHTEEAVFSATESATATTTLAQLTTCGEEDMCSHSTPPPPPQTTAAAADTLRRRKPATLEELRASIDARYAQLDDVRLGSGVGGKPFLFFAPPGTPPAGPLAASFAAAGGASSTTAQLMMDLNKLRARWDAPTAPLHGEEEGEEEEKEEEEEVVAPRREGGQQTLTQVLALAQKTGKLKEEQLQQEEEKSTSAGPPSPRAIILVAPHAHAVAVLQPPLPQTSHDRSPPSSSSSSSSSTSSSLSGGGGGSCCWKNIITITVFQCLEWRCITKEDAFLLSAAGVEAEAEAEAEAEGRVNKKTTTTAGCGLNEKEEKIDLLRSHSFSPLSHKYPSHFATISLGKAAHELLSSWPPPSPSSSSIIITLTARASQQRATCAAAGIQEVEGEGEVLLAPCPNRRGDPLAGPCLCPAHPPQCPALVSKTFTSPGVFDWSDSFRGCNCRGTLVVLPQRGPAAATTLAATLVSQSIVKMEGKFSPQNQPSSIRPPSFSRRGAAGGGADSVKENLRARGHAPPERNIIAASTTTTTTTTTAEAKTISQSSTAAHSVVPPVQVTVPLNAGATCETIDSAGESDDWDSLATKFYSSQRHGSAGKDKKRGGGKRRKKKQMQTQRHTQLVPVEVTENVAADTATPPSVLLQQQQQQQQDEEEVEKVSIRESALEHFLPHAGLQEKLRAYVQCPWWAFVEASRCGTLRPGDVFR